MVYDSEEGKVEQSQASSTSGTGTLTPTSAEAPTQDPNLTIQMDAFRRRINSSGNWFYWIAGLSIVNTIAAISGASFSFVVGLGMTQIVTALTGKLGTIIASIGFIINLAIAGIYAGLGYCSTHRMKWAFIVGIVFYSLDTLIFLVVKDIIGIVFHAYVLFCFLNGLKAMKELAKLGVKGN